MSDHADQFEDREDDEPELLEQAAESEANGEDEGGCERSQEDGE